VTTADDPRPADQLPADVRPALNPFDPETLNRCISCGFCLPACPTYLLTGEEESSPRGRITLMRDLAAGDLAADDPMLAEQSSFCLGCRACESVCPAGVHYGELLEDWRSHQWRGRRLPPLAWLLTTAVRMAWTHRVAGRVRGAAVGRHDAGGSGSNGPSLMLGCFERTLFPKVSRAARKLAPELAVPARQGCCGALHAHNGEPDVGKRMAEQLGRELPGLIVTTSGGCSAHLATVLGRDRIREFSEYVAGQGRTGGAVRVSGEVQVDGRRARAALQDSCHLRNGLGVWREPRAAVAAVADLLELPTAAGCCGAAGTYSLLRPTDSRRILDPKLDEITAAGVDYVVAVNPGCLRQLQQGLRRRRSRVRAVHLAEFLELATLPDSTTLDDIAVVRKD
jgi:glycolate oxidase iron-sulfur subunit